MQNKYELALLIKPLLPEDIDTKVMKSVEQAVKKNKGKIELKDDWGKRHLAYPINGIEEGYYRFYDMELDPSNVKPLEKSLALINDVLRFLVIKEESL